MKKKTLGKNLLFMISTTILMLILFMLFSLNVYSQTKENAMAASKEQVDQLECEYIKAVQNIMCDYGCEYSGVTMTKVYEEDGSRNYELLIHHQNLKYLNEEKMSSLENELEMVLKNDNQAKFSFIFNS